MTYDAIIIGSRVAGAATAMLLARGGYRILAVDRARFPSDTISTHIVWQPGVARLIGWGLGEQLIALEAPPISTIEFDLGPFSLAGVPPPSGPAENAYAPRRTLLDSMLANAAASAGADIRDGFTVDEIVFDGDRVAGIRGHGESGAVVIEHANIVIGADGVHSILARTIGAPEYNVHPPLTCWYYSYWSGVRNDRIRFFSREGRAFGCIPTNGGLVCIAVIWPHDRFAEVKRDIERHYLSSLDLAPDFKSEVLAGKREERFYGTAHIPNYFRSPYGRGWALVGDAGYHKDPILAQGISDAFRDASLLATALDDVFSGRSLWGPALGGYEAARNSAVAATYEMNTQFAALAPPAPDMQALMAALRGNQRDTNQFIGTMTGTVPVADFYAPENVQRILANNTQKSPSRAT